MKKLALRSALRSALMSELRFELKKHLILFCKLSMAVITLFLVACLPQEITNPVVQVSTSDKAYNGFDGLVSAQTMSSTKVKLSWNASTDGSVKAYKIYDATMVFEPKLIKTILAPATEATITGLVPQQYYSFRVRAADIKNQEDLNVHDLPAIPYAGVKDADVQTSTSAYIPFNDASNADQVNIYCKSGTNASYELVKEVKDTINSTRTLLTGLSAGVVYTCRAALVISGYVDNNPVTTTFTPIGIATKVEFSTQPGSGAAGLALIQQPIVSIKDVNGNVVGAGPDASAIITLTVAINSPTKGTIRGTYSTNAVKGVATFTDISFREAGIKVLTATKSDTSSIDKGSIALTVDSNNFSISAGAVSASRSTLSISPEVPPNSALVANGNSSYNVNFSLRDEYDNPISAVKPSFSSNIAGDTLNQPIQETDANGTTTGTISTTIADTSPLRTLAISSPTGLTTVKTLAPFVPGTATKLAFIQQPLNSPAGLLGINQLKVAIQDAQGNTVTSGIGSTTLISLSINANSNNATLSGTTVAVAVNGIAIFSDLGIDKTQTGYKIAAATTLVNYAAAYSNSFNVTNGTPKKISISGPSNLISATCSSVITIQLQDLGGNPAGALQNNIVMLNGLGSSLIYSNSSCSSVLSSTSILIASNQSSRQVYLKDLRGERLSLIAVDSSNILTSGTKTIDIYPNKISLLAQAALPAVSGTPLSVVAGQCSTALVITPTGDNGLPSPTFVSTPIQISGISGSSGKFYSDPACTVEVNPLTASLPISVGLSDYSTKLYFKDPKAETLSSVSLYDPSGLISTSSGLQTIIVGPSNISFTGPSSVVAGHCSSSFLVSLKDTLGNSVNATADTTLSINGLSSIATSQFYTSPSCAGTGSISSLTIPKGYSTVSIYLSDTAAESLSVFISDPNAKMANSPTLNIQVSPSALSITGPNPASSSTTVCAGPFTINALDGLGTPTAAVTPINVNLSGAGTAGSFFSDSLCSTKITSHLFVAGDLNKTFYFKGQYPAPALVLTATDAAGVLTASTFNFQVKAAKGWLGTAGTRLDATSKQIWFKKNIVPVSARTDGPSGAYALHVSQDGSYMYVLDKANNRVAKYDYTNQDYIGWIGGYTNASGIVVTGSSLSLPSRQTCLATPNNGMLPGWCKGGQSQAWQSNIASKGYFHNPVDLTDDGNYIYVINNTGGTINRYSASTGAFAGWIGTVWQVSGAVGLSTQPMAMDPNMPTCPLAGLTNYSLTPGWCLYGNNNQSGATDGSTNFLFTGNGRIYNPSSITYDATNNALLVARTGAIFRYDATSGAFTGWIGQGQGTSAATRPTGGASGCTSLVSGAITPGWCTGGGYFQQASSANVKIGGISSPPSIRIFNNILYVLHIDNGGTITKYDVTTGAFLGEFSNAARNWTNPYSLTSDGTYFYVAENSRLLKIDGTGTLQGWLGKVFSSASMQDGVGGTGGCAGLAPNANTPSWCSGGTSKVGIDETSFHQTQAIEFDKNGNLLVGQGSTYPGIKQFNASTGVYNGMLAHVGSSPSQWSNDPNSYAQNFGLDDGSMMGAGATYNDETYLYMAELAASRVKKFNLQTGELVGWIGGITTVPTGGIAGCTSASAMSASPGWCLGALFNPSYLWNTMISVNSSYDGLFKAPTGITGDGTYIYVLDYDLHRIQKFKASDGSYVGWIGRIAGVPTGGLITTPGQQSPCKGSTGGANAFTPTWCTGGTSINGSLDGNLWNPTAITYTGGNLYVVNSGNGRISSYNAGTGAFNGWIGSVPASPSPTPTGCTTAANGSGYSVSSSGWCFGGNARSLGVSWSPEDRGGGFTFSTRSGITTDGRSLFVSNYNLSRIDKFSLDLGVYLGSVRTLQNNTNNSWSMNTNWNTANPIPASNSNTLATWYVGYDYPIGIWTDGTYLYGTNYNPAGVGGGSYSVWKMDLTSGNMIGWQGAIRTNSSSDSPTCDGLIYSTTTTTPTWCQGGASTNGYTLGQFGGSAYYVSGDTNFIYVSDENSQRLTRIPK